MAACFGLQSIDHVQVPEKREPAAGEIHGRPVFRVGDFLNRAAVGGVLGFQVFAGGASGTGAEATDISDSLALAESKAQPMEPGSTIRDGNRLFLDVSQ